MSILVVRPRASGGLAAHVDQELAVLRRAGVDVREAAVTIRERPHLREDARTIQALRRQVAQTPGPVTVHAHGLRAGALAALALPRRRHRLVVTLHNLPIGSRATRLIGTALLRILARRADAVLAVSPDLAAAARAAGAREVHHAVIPAPAREHRSDAQSAALPVSPTDDAPSVDRGHGEPGHPAGPAPTEALRALVIARLAPQKGLDTLLDAAALLHQPPHRHEPDAPPRVHIDIAGDGPLHDQLAARIAREDLPVRLLGRREDIPALLASSDLVISAARWEGQPVSLQEALQAGRAIVATDAGGTRWVTGGAAALVPVGDAPALAAAIRALADPDVRRHAEAAARRRARDLPDAEDLLGQLRTVLTPSGAELVG